MARSRRSRLAVGFNSDQYGQNRIELYFDQLLCSNPNAADLRQIGAQHPALIRTVTKLRKIRGVETVKLSGNGLLIEIGHLFEPESMTAAVIQGSRALFRGTLPPLLDAPDWTRIRDRSALYCKPSEQLILITDDKPNSGRNFHLSIRVSDRPQSWCEQLPGGEASPTTKRLVSELTAMADLTGLRITWHGVYISIHELASWSTVQPRVIAILKRFFDDPSSVKVVDRMETSKSSARPKPDIKLTAIGMGDQQLRYEINVRLLPLGSKHWTSGEHDPTVLSRALRQLVGQLGRMPGVGKVQVDHHRITVTVGKLFDVIERHGEISRIISAALYRGRKPVIQAPWKKSTRRGTKNSGDCIEVSTSIGDWSGFVQYDLSSWLPKPDGWLVFPAPKAGVFAKNHPIDKRPPSRKRVLLLQKLLAIAGVQAVHTEPYRVRLKFGSCRPGPEVHRDVLLVLRQFFFAKSRRVSVLAGERSGLTPADLQALGIKQKKLAS